MWKICQITSYLQWCRREAAPVSESAASRPPLQKAQGWGTLRMYVYLHTYYERSGFGCMPGFARNEILGHRAWLQVIDNIQGRVWLNRH
jgi:hypothetical protein